MAHSLPPTEAWQLVERGEARILDLRTTTERRRYGAPPGAEPISLAKHVSGRQDQRRSTSVSTPSARS